MSESSWKQIVWLASYPKSGNTWVRSFMDAYFLREIDINEMVCSVADDNARRYQLGDGTDIKTMPVQIHNMMRPAALTRLVSAYKQDAIHGVPLFVKTHSANVLANGIEQIPEPLTKSVVYIARDPRDVVSSFKKHMGHETIERAIEAMDSKYNILDPEAENNKVMELISSWTNNVRSYWLTDNVFPILRCRYEDMVDDPVGSFSKILRHSGVEPDEERVRQAVELTRIDNLRSKEDESGFGEASPHAERFFGDGRYGGWRERLTDAQRIKIEKRFGRVMKSLGYL